MQRLQRIDQHAGDVLAGAQHVQRLLRHVGERVGLVRRHRIADAGLHLAPPAVIGCRRSAPGACAWCGSARAAPPASRPRCRTCGTRPRRGRRVSVRALDVVGDDRVVGAEHRAQRMRSLLTLGDALLVEVVAEDVDAVGAGQVVGHIAVEVGDGDAARGLHEGRGAEMLAHQAAVLERHAVGSR